MRKARKWILILAMKLKKYDFFGDAEPKNSVLKIVLPKKKAESKGKKHKSKH